jgi:hypothetical protein
MIFTLEVFKEVHNQWPAKTGKPAGESYDLLCMDKSNPPEHRMEEMLYYRTKEDERARVWGKSVGTLIQVGASKMESTRWRHGSRQEIRFEKAGSRIHIEMSELREWGGESL